MALTLRLSVLIFLGITEKHILILILGRFTAEAEREEVGKILQ